jgi:NRPS condensation-like uncharacterized protein
MSETINFKKTKRKVSPLERIFSRSPYAIVTMVARIKGNVSKSMLKDAVKKVQKRHQNLRVRIQEDGDHTPFFTSEGVKEIPIDIVSRESDEHWIRVYHERRTIPFEFKERHAIRFILVQSQNKSELIILCHHIICDGLSLAYLARDLMVHLGEPTREVEVLPDLVLIDKDNLPKEVSVNRIVKYFINRINKKWRKNPTYFDQEDYLSLNQAYWTNFNHQMVFVELSEDQTTVLVERCRKEKVTVNTAITSAFIAAQSIILEGKVNPNIVVATSFRERLPKPVGQAVGYFAGGVSLEHKYNQKMSFWDNSRELHKKLKPLYGNKNLFKEIVPWLYLEPGIMESLSFKMIGELVSPDSSRYNKLSSFSKREDVISSLLKKQNMDSLEEPFLGTAVTNLGRLDFPQIYGKLELDRLIMNPGGMFPLAMVNLVVGAVTCSGKLSLLVEYAEETIDSATVEKIKEEAIGYLLEK